MKNLKTFIEFINEADAKTALNVIGSKEQQKTDVNQDRKTPEGEKEQKFQQKTKNQALTRTDELEKAAKDIDTRQQTANKRMDDITLKQDLLPDDPNKRKEFLDSTKNDLKDVEGELNNAEQQRKSLQKQKDRIKNNFLKK
jgi:chromosome segregation ATPase